MKIINRMCIATLAGALALIGGCRESPTVEIVDPIVEKAIRSGYSLNKPTGKLTKADLEKVTELDLSGTKITDAGVAELKKALPKCTIRR